jgi:hypothetical protein
VALQVVMVNKDQMVETQVLMELPQMAEAEAGLGNLETLILTIHVVKVRAAVRAAEELDIHMDRLLVILQLKAALAHLLVMEILAVLATQAITTGAAEAAEALEAQVELVAEAAVEILPLA